ncbi:MAG: dihydroorotase family protein [Anaerolineae bacterium]|nr:dihydroorotase family protein [Anaerolineae bacterium]
MSRLVKIPGMVDPHTHLRDLDWSHKATFTSETGAALAGGYWCVFDMPNTPPTTTDAPALATKQRALAAGAVCDYGIYFGAAQRDNTGEYGAVWPETCGLKIFNNATTGDLLIDTQPRRAAHYAAWPAQRLIAVHAEDETVADILALVRQTRKRTHFVHISTAQEIAWLRAAKAEGLPVTVGVCPHHLYLTEDDVPRLRGYGIMKPGLKTKADQAALWQALADGVVDVIESDHAPHSRAEKEGPVPPYGVPGLETTLPLLLTAVAAGRLTLAQVSALVAEQPRRIWGLACPPETYALVDLDAAYVIEAANLHSQCGWSPFEGLRVRGRVVETWLRGQRVYADGRILAQPGSGRDVFGGAV